jgi:hypothetical protein
LGIENIASKRSILFSARMRFSPAAQPIKDTAIGKMVEQKLLLADKEGLPIQQIQQQSTVGVGDTMAALSRPDLERALAKLDEAGWVVTSQDSGREN